MGGSALSGFGLACHSLACDRLPPGLQNDGSAAHFGAGAAAGSGDWAGSGAALCLGRQSARAGWIAGEHLLPDLRRGAGGAARLYRHRLSPILDRGVQPMWNKNRRRLAQRTAHSETQWHRRTAGGALVKRHTSCTLKDGNLLLIIPSYRYG